MAGVEHQRPAVLPFLPAAIDIVPQTSSQYRVTRRKQGDSCNNAEPKVRKDKM